MKMIFLMLIMQCLIDLTLIMKSSARVISNDGDILEWVLFDPLSSFNQSDNNNSNITITQSPTPPVTIIFDGWPSNEGGKTFVISRCFSATGKCCISGHFGLDVNNFVSISVRGTTSACGSTLQSGISQSKIGMLSALGSIEIPISSIGLQSIKLQMNSNGDKITFVGTYSNPDKSIVPDICSGTSTWLFSLNYGIKNKFLPADESISDNSDQEVSTSNEDQINKNILTISFSVGIATLALAYLLIPPLISKKYGGNFEHPHIRSLCNCIKKSRTLTEKHSTCESDDAPKKEIKKLAPNKTASPIAINISNQQQSLDAIRGHPTARRRSFEGKPLNSPAGPLVPGSVSSS